MAAAGAAAFLAAAGFLAFCGDFLAPEEAFLTPAFFTPVFLAPAGFLAFFGAADFLATLSPRRKEPEAPVPLVCFNTPDDTPRFNAWRKCELI